MDMSMTMSMTPSMTGMSSMSMTKTATAAAATSSMAMGGMGGMGGMSMGGSCKISMLWNWYTIDSCFLARSWHVRTTAQFAGSCIGVLLLVVALEFIRRSQREYDRYIVRSAARGAETPLINDDSRDSISSANKNQTAITVTRPFGAHVAKPTLIQQAVRSFFYMVQFTIAYLIMLLAMYYNGYIIICIILGAFIGHFIWAWDNITFGANHQETGTSCC